MTVSPGTKLGPYEILTLIGAGGMGEVYRAKDTRLDRTVAIKILPSHLSSNPDLKQRFEREARTISNLSHPNICALYDIGHQDGTDYLVMEYLEGETLAQRLIRGSLPIEQVLRYGMQIADALDRAHRQGVIHRDLKPGNVMLTKSGAKLLDFGLAKLDPSSKKVVSSASILPTEARDLTAEGTILGTIQYMSPEQLEGRDVDARSDIFALGLVLYEAITGRKAFHGKSQASLIAAILERDPESISAIQPLTPPALDRLVKTCLAKDPDERWQSAHDVTSELKWIFEAGSGAGIPTPLAAVRKKRDRLVSALLGLILGAAVASAIWFMVRSNFSKPLPVTRLSIPIPPSDDVRSLAFSPDGSKLICSTRNSKFQLYLRSMDNFNATPIKDTEGSLGPHFPFFSPDGRWIGFHAGGKLKKVSVQGGAALNICPIYFFHGATWAADDMIYFVPNFTAGVWKVSAAGGTPQLVAKPDPVKGERAFLFPDALPGGKAVLLNVYTGGSTDDNRIVAQPLPSGERKVLLEKASFACYLAPGYLLYLHGGSLFAISFDAEKLQVRGVPIEVVDGIFTYADNGTGILAFSGNGSLAYVPGPVYLPKRSLAWVDRKGQATLLSIPKRSYATKPRISPDGTLVALSTEESTFDLWTLNTMRNTLTRFSFYGDETMGTWTPDGKRLIYTSSRDGDYNLYWKPVDGSGPEERLTESKLAHYAWSVSPDGKVLLFDEEHMDTNTDIWILPLQGERKPYPFLKTNFIEDSPHFSPDGRSVVYCSNESGRYEVYVKAFPGPAGKWQISTQGGEHPRWSPKGDEIFFQNGNKFMQVPIDTKNGFKAGEPVTLFEGNYNDYDVSPDGQRFFMVTKEEKQDSSREIRIILNWFDEFQRRMKQQR